MTYLLCRLNDDGSTTEVSEHGNIVEGIAAGKRVVECEDFDYPYALHANGSRLAMFGSGRIGYREWARRSGRLDYIHSLDDRYDHDVDELLAVS